MDVDHEVKFSAPNICDDPDDFDRRTEFVAITQSDSVNVYYFEISIEEFNDFACGFTDKQADS